MTAEKKIAVLGAGIQGACLALELARRGCKIDLYEQASEAVTAASLWNEGKIHLGFVFANDTTTQTARKMILGALHFGHLLKRWCGLESMEQLLSEPFCYAVLRDSLLDDVRVEAYFSSVAAIYRDLSNQLGCCYLDARPTILFERVPQNEVGSLYDNSRVAAAFRTAELSLDPQLVAAHLRSAIGAHTAIGFIAERRVEAVAPCDDGRLLVISRDQSEHRVRYDHVVNSLWGDRLRIDATMGIKPARDWLFRYKVALHVSGAGNGGKIPSTTMVLGPYGDVVNFGDGRLYLSWYPVSRLGMSSDLCPPDFGASLGEKDKVQLSRRMWAELSAIVPSLAGVDSSSASERLDGGIIFAWGATDIDDRESGLHQRFDIGPHSYGNYHSVDTGKYCMAPIFAVELADRIAPRN